jgi:hypothetical protein
LQGGVRKNEANPGDFIRCNSRLPGEAMRRR